MNEDGSKARGIIAIVATASLVLLTGMLFFREPPAGAKEILLILVGLLGALVTQVTQFYFGSSSGAKQLVANQNEIIKAAATGTGNGLSTASPAGTTADPVKVQEVVKEPEDPRYTKFAASVLAINDQASEAEIKKAWDSLPRRVDFDPTRSTLQ